jgi:hypothetical protein
MISPLMVLKRKRSKVSEESVSDGSALDENDIALLKTYVF